MKNKYESPIAEKIKFNYRDQVVAASGAENIENGDNGNNNGGNSLVQNSFGVGGYLCGSGGIMDYVADWINICD